MTLSGNIVSRNVLILGIPSPFVIVLTLGSLLLGPGAVPTDTTLSNGYGYVKNHKKSVKKRTRERMSDQEAKEIKAEAREIMPQPSTVNCSFHSQLPKPTPLFYKFKG
ncbi:hypothetical protein Tco_0162108 [Tanacetum coccineum]